MSKAKTVSWEDFKKPRKTKRLDDWKDDGSVVVYVHTNSGITPRLFHLVPYVDIDNETKKKIIRYFPFVCHESIESYFAKESPKHCPICRSIDWAANTKMKNDSDVMWEAVIGDPKKDRISTKLDYCGLEGGDWKQSFKPRLQYVFAVIDATAENPVLQIAIEPSSIHDGIRKVVIQQIEKNGENGDPSINPYPFRFKYNPKSKKPADYYEVMEWSGKTELTDEIIELLNSGPIDIGYYIDPTPSDKLYDIMKEHFKGKKALDTFFDNVIVDSKNDFNPSEIEEEEVNSKVVKEDEEEEEAPVKAESKEEADESDTEDDEDASDDRTPCETCAGTGKVGKKKTPCPDCDGTGYVEAETSDDDSEIIGEDDEESSPCETCSGTGKVGKKNNTCPDCDGTGHATDEEEEVVEEKPAPAKKPSKAEKPKADKTPPEEMSQCYNCKKMVPDSAKKCPHCGEEFADDEDD